MKCSYVRRQNNKDLEGNLKEPVNPQGVTGVEAVVTSEIQPFVTHAVLVIGKLILKSKTNLL